MSFDEFCNDNEIFDNERKAFRKFVASELNDLDSNVESSDLEEEDLDNWYDEFSDDVLDSDEEEEDED